MKTIQKISSYVKSCTEIRSDGKRLGFVPTMGCLHEGHLSLIRRAKRENDAVAVSIFVNPTQFGPKEDFKKYPRMVAQDLKLLRQEGVDLVFLPSVEDFYPEKFQTFVSPGPMQTNLCGLQRPGHFKGVLTVVAMLFNLTGPCVTYLGQKDYQQYRLIKQMVQDLHFPVSLKICPIYRESSGLAMSSRNRYLSDQGRLRAAILAKTLKEAKLLIAKGEKRTFLLKKKIYSILKKASIEVEYVEFVNPESLESLKTIAGPLLIAVAIRIEGVRLIDNLLI